MNNETEIRKELDASLDDHMKQIELYTGPKNTIKGQLEWNEHKLPVIEKFLGELNEILKKHEQSGNITHDEGMVIAREYLTKINS